MNPENYLRKLAKKTEVLHIFEASKEINGIKLFINEINLSKLQNSFLNYLYFYHSLFQDVYSDKVSKKVTDNEIYEDAYYYYKSKTINKSDKESSKKANKLQAVFSKDNKIIFPEKKEDK